LIWWVLVGLFRSRAALEAENLVLRVPPRFKGSVRLLNLFGHLLRIKEDDTAERVVTWDRIETHLDRYPHLGREIDAFLPHLA